MNPCHQLSLKRNIQKYGAVRCSNYSNNSNRRQKRGNPTGGFLQLPQLEILLKGVL